MSEEEFFCKVKEEFLFQINANDEEISQRAFKEIKEQKHTLPNKIFEYKNRDKKAIFMAGSAGAGKTEVAQLLKAEYQKASSRGVNILLNYAFNNELSFILDGNFSDYDMQKRNIERAKLHNYSSIEVNYIYRPVDVAKKYTKEREKRSGRRVPDDVFVKKSLGAIESVSRLLDDIENSFDMEDIKVNFYDLVNENIIENISKKEFLSLMAKDLMILVNAKTEIKDNCTGNPYTKDYCEVPDTNTDKDNKKNSRKIR